MCIVSSAYKIHTCKKIQSLEGKKKKITVQKCKNTESEILLESTPEVAIIKWRGSQSFLKLPPSPGSPLTLQAQIHCGVIGSKNLFL